MMTDVAHVRVHTGTGLFVRSAANPVLTVADWPYQVTAVFNPAAAVVNGETVLLCRVEDGYGASHLTVARSSDGVGGWRVDATPLISGDPVWGVENPRATWVGELGCWVIAYIVCGPQGPHVALASTRDFRTVDVIGSAVPPDDKDASLLARHVDGEFVLLHRPYAPNTGRADVWLSRSVDLRSWSAPEPVMRAREGQAWDSWRVGMGPPPIETPAGWLGVYHGVKRLAHGPIYRVGLVLLDLQRPERVLRRSREWVLAPTEPYERVGNAPNVVFPTGITLNPDTDELRLYYGAADTAVAMASARLSELMDYILRCPADGAV
jgi:predicted GH43/DUF377 family glycosyl hydrolase